MNNAMLRRLFWSLDIGALNITLWMLLAHHLLCISSWKAIDEEGRISLLPSSASHQRGTFEIKHPYRRGEGHHHSGRLHLAIGFEVT
ncbi:hypothetical protein HF086_007322 [Spodoptera exigua]|uniref:Uncharacterized protein n=1 Tax=Spodoptera exigua TaxID=7107 RepID=A0A922MPB7_SPOEX|nr:hypothetical protein HF086_007322 [Spodoptera exigua]